MFFIELCYVFFQKPQFLQWIIHRVASISSPASSSLEACLSGFPVVSSRRLVASAAPGSISSPRIIRFYTPFTQHQFLQWMWRLCYTNIHCYNEVDRPLQIISKSCKNIMCYTEFCTCFKHIFVLHWNMYFFFL